MKPTLYAACDFSYFCDHGYALAKSAADNNMKIVIEMFPTLDGDYVSMFDRFFANWVTKRDEAIFEHVDLRGADEKLFTDLLTTLTIEDRRAFYACYRFLAAPRWLHDDDNILIIDADSIIRNPVELPDGFDLGLYLREGNVVGANTWEVEGMKVAAGAVFLTRRASAFAVDVANHIIYNPVKWFADQAALWAAYGKYKDTLNVVRLDELPVVDWDFIDGTMIWTGKGRRKFDDPKYVAAKATIDALE